MSDHLNEHDIKDFYETINEIWPAQEDWYVYAKNQIRKFLHDNPFLDNAYVLNAGSAGNDYDLPYKMHHVDIAKSKISHLDNATVASVENLPFKSSIFDNAICVGSVINYCDAVVAISELCRVIKPNGILMLEFESSDGFEYRNTEEYRKAAVVVNVKYIEKSHTQWLYSYKYIKSILRETGFIIIKVFPFHTLSSLYLSKNADENRAAKFAKYDRFLRYLPRIRMHGNNILIMCKKS